MLLFRKFVFTSRGRQGFRCFFYSLIWPGIQENQVYGGRLEVTKMRMLNN